MATCLRSAPPPAPSFSGAGPRRSPSPTRSSATPLLSSPTARSEWAAPPGPPAAAPALLQGAWTAALAPASSLISHSAPLLAYGPLGVGGAAWAAIVLLGALPGALRQPTVVDLITRTR